MSPRLTEEQLLVNVYKSITTPIDLSPENYFQVSGSMSLEGYKSKGRQYTSRQVKNTQTMCSNSLVKDFLQQEFDKRNIS